jgi:hypothetical protein
MGMTELILDHHAEINQNLLSKFGGEPRGRAYKWANK